MIHVAAVVVSVVGVLCGIVGGLTFSAIRTKDEIENLKARVACLEHPAGASSIAGRLVSVRSGRTFVVTQPAHRTGCK
jgi:hypothetical protein